MEGQSAEQHSIDQRVTSGESESSVPCEGNVSKQEQRAIDSAAPRDNNSSCVPGI